MLIHWVLASALWCAVWTTGVPASAEPAVPLPLPKTAINPKDSAEMVLVPAGKFLLGTSDEQLAVWLAGHPTDQREWFTSEQPQRTVELDTFYVYTTEVTVAQYRTFCRMTKRAMPEEPAWKWQYTHPIVNVSWEDAKAYADWAGAALPTEAEWEKAARGTDGRIFPWGNDWDATKCSNSVGKHLSKTSPVGSFPAGASPYGCLDMTGNVYEWCTDWLSANGYQTTPAKNPTGPATGTKRVLRGGSWLNGSSKNLRAADRFGFYPAEGGDVVGFRCVMRVQSAIPSAYDGKPGTIAGQQCVNPKDGATMVWVPAGEFLMGSNDDYGFFESPLHSVYLDGYWIYKTDVTVAQYKAYCAAEAVTVPKAPEWGWQDAHPMVNVIWNEARTYAKWAGAQLPSEAQWEKAARGTDGRLYPWGNDWDVAKCNNLESTQAATTPVGMYLNGVSPYGCLDMAGNVWQWCEDWFGQKYYTGSPVRNPKGPDTGEERVLRGGSWCDINLITRTFRCAYRLWLDPTDRRPSAGFRCIVVPLKDGPPAYDGKPGTTAGQQCVNPKDNAVMVWVPAGSFLMGSTDADEKAADIEKPQHTVDLDGYWIYQTAVTVAQYKAYCATIGEYLPKEAPAYGWHDTYPMVEVNWSEARAYAKWAGAKLPSEAQWEMAARGTDGRIYPWGNSWNKLNCCSSVATKQSQPQPVGVFPNGASPYGCLDMAGNVYQWCEDWYGEKYYETSPTNNPPGPETGDFRVLLGGSWSDVKPLYFRCASRVFNTPTARDNSSGFRCVVSPQGK